MVLQAHVAGCLKRCGLSGADLFFLPVETGRWWVQVRLEQDTPWKGMIITVKYRQRANAAHFYMWRDQVRQLWGVGGFSCPPEIGAGV